MKNLEYDHKIPFALGGKSVKRAGIKVFGLEKMTFNNRAVRFEKNSKRTKMNLKTLSRIFSKNPHE
jgi:hypothetical protein